MQRLFLLVLISALLAAGCAPVPAGPSLQPLPEQLNCRLSPKKKAYLPFEEVDVCLVLGNNRVWKEEFSLPYHEFQLSALSKIDGKENRQVDWQHIEQNGYGGQRGISSTRWFLTRQWSGIIPQKAGEYRIAFVIASPEHYWQVKEMTVRIAVPLDEAEPYQRLMERHLDSYFARTYAARVNNAYPSMAAQVPKERLPYEEILLFMKDYPYSAFTKFFVKQAEKTRHFLTGLKVDYVKEDMAFIDEILQKGQAL